MNVKKFVKNKISMNKICIICYILIIFAASLPIMNGYLYRGHDIYFHLMRIEGLAQGLRNGTFPVRIQPLWYEDFGYAVSVFYGDLFLYIGAGLRLLGLSLQNAYKGYLFICNVVTVILSGYSFSRIFDSKWIGVFGSALYSLSVYHLVNLYTRGALGEYTGMIFWPLLIYACTLLLNKESENEKIKKGTWLLGISMACMLQSHLLTAQLACIMLSILMLCMIKRVLNKKVILAGCKAVFMVLGLSAWFLVPFLDYMLTQSFKVNSTINTEVSVQRQGVSLRQLLNLFDNAIGESLDLSAGISGDFAQGVGFVFFLAAPIALAVGVFFWKKEKKYSMLAVFSFLFGMGAMLTSTYYFPWDAVAGICKLFAYFVTNIQFPWRMTAIGVSALTCLWCWIVWKIQKSGYLRLSVGMAIMAIGLLTASMGYFFCDLSQRGNRIEVASLADMDSSVQSGEEYLPLGTDVNCLEVEKLNKNDKITIEKLEKNGTDMRIICTNNLETKQLLELPLLYYRGYEAVADNTKLLIFAGENNVATVILPQGTHEITVSFKEPWYWRAAEFISFLYIVVIIRRLAKKIYWEK